jgi:hypothetical protein
VAHMAAATLVHEWEHHEGKGEAAGYDAGAEFALKMGEHAIAREQLSTKAQTVRDEQETAEASRRERGRW